MNEWMDEWMNHLEILNTHWQINWFNSSQPDSPLFLFRTSDKRSMETNVETLHER